MVTCPWETIEFCAYDPNEPKSHINSFRVRVVSDEEFDINQELEENTSFKTSSYEPTISK